MIGHGEILLDKARGAIVQGLTGREAFHARLATGRGRKVVGGVTRKVATHEDVDLQQRA